MGLKQKFRTPLLIALAGVISTFLGDAIREIREMDHSLEMAVILVLALVGLAKILLWIDELIFGRPKPSYPPLEWLAKPYIHSGAWPELPLTLNEQNVAKAFELAASDAKFAFLIITEDLREISVSRAGFLWQIDKIEPERRFREIAVPADSKWAEWELKWSFPKVLFTKQPEHLFREQQAKEILYSLLGWQDSPDNLAWARIRFRDRKDH
ncbi:MAG: hypothetical protein H6918_06185 [Sphingomonadaceae bacterium]|nr:hypothetical protein [Sphingomonadaceae bacterium]